MMRSITLLLLIGICSTVSAQTVWVADNNFNAPTGPNVFSTIQAAVDAASSGDIVQVQPSPTKYGSVTIDKQITLMGIGFALDKEIPLSSQMTNITLTNNIDNTSDSDGSIITGLRLDAIIIGLNSGPDFTIENITIHNNLIFQYIYNGGGSNYSPIDGLEIRNNYFSGAFSDQSIYFLDPATNVIIRNNLIAFGIEFGSATPGVNIISNNIMYEFVNVTAEGSNTTILNNNFIATSGGDAAFARELRDCIVANNIFYGMTPSIANAGNSTSTSFQRNSFTNNLVFSTGDDVMPPAGGGVGNSGSGNIVGSPLFVDVQLLNTHTSTYDFTLQAGSPALLAGSDGTDIGISGGSYPITETNFSLKTTAAPTIQILNSSTVINPGDDLPVRIQAKSN